ncbi:lipase/esterase [Exophiala viscosa]|uniref:Lipase/esterase n=1 Tax=Exophiala viscosa TaxID=2486360 RepID=A0AAN6E0Y3_9EURO|nr:lipase/esterase [Exophiala viscosa]
MDDSPTAILRVVLPRLPLILKTALFNALSLSKNSSRQDVTTEVAVVVLRSVLQVRKPMRVLQKTTTRDPGIKGPILIAKVSVPISQEGDVLKDLLNRAIKELGNGSETYTPPELTEVQAEWTGYKVGAAKNEPRPDLAEEDHYRILMGSVSSPTTILYFHGGAYFLLDPASHRKTTSYLAKLTGGRCYSVRYRLAPQYPFPAQLLDALMSYLSLLSPPPGMPHEPVAAHNIVFAGDSAGGNLAIALLQLLLTLRRMGMTTITFHGVEVPIHLPAGVAVNSPWVDIGRSMPSINNNAHFDYLDPPSAVGISKAEPTPDDLWPTSPPRAEIFCNASMLVHPLTSPLSAAPELLKGMPPVFMCLGNEGLEDEITILARRMHQGGGTVSFMGYEGMPHCFAMVFPTAAMAKDCFQRWAKFCSDVSRGSGPSSSRAIWSEAFANPPKFRELEMDNISKLTDSDVLDSMKERQNYGIEREQDAVKRWNEHRSRAKL